MIVVISIAAVVALISLYDYFSSKAWQQVTSDTRNDTVFAERNKAYGAYVMRRDYDKRLLLIIAAVVGAAGVFYASTRGGEAEKTALRPDNGEFVTIINFDKKDDKQPELPKEIATTELPPAGAEATFVEPRVSDTEPEPGTLPSDPGVVIGPVIGDPGGFGEPLPPGPGGQGDPIVEPVTPPPGIPEYVDEPAEFPGGRPALLAYLGDNMRYPEAEAQLGIEGKVYLRFVVSKVGDISQVEVMRGVTDCSACDKEAVRVVKGMPNWRPGKINGKPVDSRFNLPVTFKLRDN